MNRMKSTTSLIACLVTLAGCSTPAPVLELASHGVAVTTEAETELDTFVRRSNVLYVQRLESIRRIAAGDIDANAKTRFENKTAEKAGMTAQAELVKLIKELSDERAKARDEAQKQYIELEKQLGTGSEPLQIPKEKLAEIKKGFATLSQELSRKEWLDFAIGYGKDIGETVKKSKDDASAAGDTAKAEDNKQESKTKIEAAKSKEK